MSSIATLRTDRWSCTIAHDVDSDGRRIGKTRALKAVCNSTLPESQLLRSTAGADLFLKALTTSKGYVIAQARSS